MADVVVTNDVDTFLRSADNAAARTNLEVYSDAEVDAKVATKAVAGGVYFDGGNAKANEFANFWENGGTFSFWLKTEDPRIDGENKIIYDSRATSSEGWAVIINYTNGKIQINHTTSGTVLVSVCDNIPPWGDWFFVAVEWDGSVDSSAPKWYINGELQSTDAATNATGNLVTTATTGQFGSRLSNGSDILYGSLRNVQFFNRALSAAEVAELYESGTVAVEDRWGATESTPDGVWVASTSHSWTSLTSSSGDGFTGVSDGSSRALIDLLYTQPWNKKVVVSFEVTAIGSATGFASIGNFSADGTGTELGAVALNGTGVYQIVLADAGAFNSNFKFRIIYNDSGITLTITNFTVEVFGCIADLPLDEGTGTKFYDRSPNNYNATGSDTGITHLLPIEPRDERERLGVTAQLNTKETAGGASLINVGNGGIIVSTTAGEPIAIGSVYSVSLMLKINRVSSSGHVFIFGENSNNRGGLQVLSAGQIQFGERINGVSSTQCPRTNYEIGKWFHVVCVANSGNYELYIDGVLATNVATYGLLGAVTGFRFGNGTIASDLGRDIEINSAKIFNRALTATEVQELHDTNTVAVADRWGYTEIKDFESGITGVSVTNSQGSNAVASHETVSPITGTGSVKITDSGTSTSSNYPRIYFDGFTSFEKNTKYRLSFKTELVSGSATLQNIRFGNSGLNYFSISAEVLSGTQSFDIELTTDNTVPLSPTSLMFTMNGTVGAGTYLFDDIKLTRLGAIADLPLDEGIGYQFHDRSSNHFDALASTSGVTHLVPKTEGFVREFGVNAYNGGAGAWPLITSSRDIVPVDAILEYVSVWNPTSNLVASGLTFQASVGTASASTFCTFGSTISATSSRGKTVDFTKSTGRENILVTAPTDTNATDLNVKVSYKVI